VSITSTDYANPCIRLRCSREAGPLLVEGNRIALRRLFANLLDNALRFGRPAR
jgi:signal transduction histidine kinase